MGVVGECVATARLRSLGKGFGERTWEEGFTSSHFPWSLTPCCRWFIMEDIQVGRYNGGFAMARKVGMGNSHRIGPAISISLRLVPELTPSLLPSLVRIPDCRP